MGVREEVEYSGTDVLVWDDESTETADVFFEEFLKTKLGQILQAQALITSTNVEAIVDYAKRAFDDEQPTFAQFCQSAKVLFLSGDLEPDPVVVDDRPKDRLGRPMSPKAIQWQTWERWCNHVDAEGKRLPGNPPSTKQIKERCSDPAFREFYEHQWNLRLQENRAVSYEELTGHQQPMLAGLPAAKKVLATEKLKLFAYRYRRTPSEWLKPVDGCVTLFGGLDKDTGRPLRGELMSHTELNALVSDAANAGYYSPDGKWVDLL